MADSSLKAVSPEKNPPTIHVELTQTQAKALSGSKPGAIVRLKIKGKLISIELREPYEESKEKYVGSMSLEIQDMTATGHTVFDDLAEDE